MFRKGVPKTQRACEGKSRVDTACRRWVDSKYQNWSEQGMLQVTCRKSEIHRGARKGVHLFKGWTKYLFPHLQRNRLLSTINQRVSKMPQHLKDKPLFGQICWATWELKAFSIGDLRILHHSAPDGLLHGGRDAGRLTGQVWGFLMEGDLQSYILWMVAKACTSWGVVNIPCFS